MTMIRPDFDALHKKGTIIKPLEETDSTLADLIR